MVCSSGRCFGLGEDGKEELRTEMVWKGWLHRRYRQRPSVWQVNRSGAYIAKLAAAADELAQIRGEVIAAVVLLDAARPVILASADQDVLCVVGDEPIEGRFTIDFEARGHLGRRRAWTCWRRAGRCCRKPWCLGRQCPSRRGEGRPNPRLRR